MRSLQLDDLRLEPQLSSHAAAMFEVLSDPAIYLYENSPPASVEWLYERYRKLESRSSSNGQEKWLNWVIRLADDRLAGYVQATVFADHSACIAYELHSQFWGKSIARRAVTAMMVELQQQYEVTQCYAIFKTANFRSQGLLLRLGFAAGECPAFLQCDEDESFLQKTQSNAEASLC